MVAACQGFHTRTPIHKHICTFSQPAKWRSLLSLWQATLHDRWPVFNVTDLNIACCIGNAVFGLPALFRKQKKRKEDRKRVNCWQVQQVGGYLSFGILVSLYHPYVTTGAEHNIYFRTPSELSFRSKVHSVYEHQPELLKVWQTGTEVIHLTWKEASLLP